MGCALAAGAAQVAWNGTVCVRLYVPLSTVLRRAPLRTQRSTWRSSQYDDPSDDPRLPPPATILPPREGEPTYARSRPETKAVESQSVDLRMFDMPTLSTGLAVFR